MTDVAQEHVVARLRTLTGRAALIARRHPVRFDCAVALLLAIASLLGLASQNRRIHHLDTVILCLALCAPLPLRTISRRLSFALISVVALVQWFVSTPQVADGAVLVALFWIVLEDDVRDIVVASIVCEAGAIMAAFRWSPDEPEKVWVGVTGLAVAAAALGLAIRERRAVITTLHERAARLERERDQQTQIAAAAERARIAREMHDIVSHNLTVMIGLADGASYALDAEPDAARGAIQRVSATGREALAEMRRLLGVLRDTPESGSLEPQPGLEHLDELLARVEAAGIPVTTEIKGDLRRLPAGMQLAIFRIAQEALTNTLRHAVRPATARVALACDDDHVELEVTDTGRASAQPVTIQPQSRGLRGMRERAAAYGGQLDAGPVAGGGWRVSLILDAAPDGGVS